MRIAPQKLTDLCFHQTLFVQSLLSKRERNCCNLFQPIRLVNPWIPLCRTLLMLPSHARFSYINCHVFVLTTVGGFFFHKNEIELLEEKFQTSLGFWGDVATRLPCVSSEKPSIFDDDHPHLFCSYSLPTQTVTQSFATASKSGSLPCSLEFTPSLGTVGSQCELNSKDVQVTQGYAS